MSFTRPIPPKSFSVSRVNKMLGRIYSLALVGISIEALVNGFSQLQYLNQYVFYPSVLVLVLVVAAILYTQWFSDFSAFWLKSIAYLSGLLLLTWPLHFNPDQALPYSFQPWIWWLVGISSVAAGTSFSFRLGIAYLFAISGGWLILKTSSFGGPGQLIDAIQDTIHSFIFASMLVAMVLALRWEAAKVDAANQLAIETVVESAKTDAIELERSRMDSLVHDSVLTTLLIAARANNPEQIESARKSAREAIARLEQVGDETDSSSEMSLVSFFEALQLRIKEHAPEFTVVSDSPNDSPIDSVSAEALAEATIQAIDNSLKHAGDPTERLVRLRGQKTGLKIAVVDNGRGFRPSKISKDRLGITSSIVKRVEKVGGRAFVQASPGRGTTVIIEWAKND